MDSCAQSMWLSNLERTNTSRRFGCAGKETNSKNSNSEPTPVQTTSCDNTGNSVGNNRMFRDTITTGYFFN